MIRLKVQKIESYGRKTYQMFEKCWKNDQKRRFLVLCLHEFRRCWQFKGQTCIQNEIFGKKRVVRCHAHLEYYSHSWLLCTVKIRFFWSCKLSKIWITFFEFLFENLKFLNKWHRNDSWNRLFFRFIFLIFVNITGFYLFYVVLWNLTTKI